VKFLDAKKFYYYPLLSHVHKTKIGITQGDLMCQPKLAQLLNQNPQEDYIFKANRSKPEIPLQWNTQAIHQASQHQQSRRNDVLTAQRLHRHTRFHRHNGRGM